MSRTSRKASTPLILAGYLLSLLGGLLGIGVGGFLWQGKVKTPEGRKVLKYDAGTRRHGLVMVVLGFVVFGAGARFKDQLKPYWDRLYYAAPDTTSAAQAPREPTPEEAAVLAEMTGEVQPDATAQSPVVRATDPTPTSSSSAPQTAAPAAASRFSLATASDENTALVLRYLDAGYEKNLLGEGYGSAFHSFAGSQEASGADRVSLTIPGGQDVAVLGVCDNECRNLDIVIRDRAGSVLGEDVLGDDVPLVRLQIRDATTLVIEVRMTACSAGPCYYAVGVFRKP